MKRPARVNLARRHCGAGLSRRWREISPPASAIGIPGHSGAHLIRRSFHRAGEGGHSKRETKQETKREANQETKRETKREVNKETKQEVNRDVRQISLVKVRWFLPEAEEGFP
jgi:hypothetical protein